MEKARLLCYDTIIGCRKLYLPSRYVLPTQQIFSVRCGLLTNDRLVCCERHCLMLGFGVQPTAVHSVVCLQPSLTECLHLLLNQMTFLIVPLLLLHHLIHLLHPSQLLLLFLGYELLPGMLTRSMVNQPTLRIHFRNASSTSSQ